MKLLLHAVTNCNMNSPFAKMLGKLRVYLFFKLCYFYVISLSFCAEKNGINSLGAIFYHTMPYHSVVQVT